MSAVQLQPHATGTVSRSDVTLHDGNKNDEDTHNHAHDAGGVASGNNGSAAGADTEDAAPKGFWSWLCCCVLQKTNKKDGSAASSSYDKKNGGGDGSKKADVGMVATNKTAAAGSAAAGSAANGTDTKAAAPPADGGVNSLVTQVDPNAPVPVVTPAVYNPGTRPGAPAKCLLGPLPDSDRGKKTLVLDLDETLVHSSFKPIPNADFVISIELENVIHRVFVLKRPGVDAFLRAVGAKFEVVVFTASLAKYADPLLDILDRNKIVKTRLFREACVHHYGNYVKDLSHLGRRLEDTIIIDNSPFSYMFQPDNAIPITSWFNDKNDRQLYDLLPFLDSLTTVEDVCTHLHRRKQQQLAAGNNMA